MKNRKVIILFFFGILIGTSCSNKVANEIINKPAFQSAGTGPITCDPKTGSCPSGMQCDYFSRSGSAPTCKTACITPGVTGNPCTSGEICNPVTGFCEPKCSQDEQCSVALLNGRGQCSSATSGSGYCSISCGVDTDCQSPGLNLPFKCFNKTCYSKPNTQIPDICPSGQQSIQGVCQFQSCSTDQQCTIPGFAKCYNNSYCVPDLCNGQVCGPNEQCLNGKCVCGSTGAACANSLKCSAPDNTGICQCGNTGAACSGSETCNGSTCQCGNGPACGNAGTCTDGQCFCGLVVCAAGQICSSSKCVTPAPVQCGSSVCSVGQICANASTTNANCITKGCGDGQVDSGAGEVCDEGLQPETPSSVNCPDKWSFNASSSKCEPQLPGAGNGNNGHCSRDCKAQCVIENGTSKPATKFWDVAKISTALSKLNTIPCGGASAKACDPGLTCSASGQDSGTCRSSNTCNLSADPIVLCPIGQTCSSTTGPGYCQISTWDNSTSISVNTSQCPNGLGIWVLQNASETSMENSLSISNSVAILGGFATSTDKSPQGRSGTNGKPLGKGGFSGSILNGGSGTVVVLGSDKSSIQVALDGFQIKGGSAGGVLVNASTTAILNNLRVSRNTTTGSGGGIRNLGKMSLSNSFISLNKAQTQGGGVSHESSNTSTIENVIFWGNGFSIQDLVPTCTEGDSSCPSGFNCSNNICIFSGTTPTCSSSNTCPRPWTAQILTSGACSCQAPSCSSNSCPLPFTKSKSSVCTCVAQSYSDSSFQNGGAIAATGGGKINVYASKFNGNYAYGRGGGIYSENTMNIVSSVFTANWASFAGGGVYVANKPATLYNLTFVDNRAYIQGGGGIYNVPTDSQLYASIFRNNIGLYPVNKASAAEWTGNQGTGVTDQINSVNGIIATNMHYVDMCPVISYEYGKGVDGADAGVCNGSSLCGSIPTALKAGSIPASLDKVSLNRLAYSYNECSTSEFVDCNAPTYSNCSPQNSTVPSSESIKTGSPSFCLAYLYSSTYSPPYKKDFAGNKLASASGDEISLGAYQCTITCPLGTDLREDQCCLSIHKNTCYDCSSFNPSGTCPSGQICSSSQCANSCSSSNPKGACPSGTTCYSGKCAGSCSSSNPSGFCPSGQKCLNGNCFSLCNKGETCPSGKTCLSGVCL